MKSIRARIAAELREIEEKGLRRSVSAPAGLDFSSNDYLGLANSEELNSALMKGIGELGVGSTGSRLLRGHREVFSNVEREFAEWKGAEASLYFATGYQANVGMLQTFLREGDEVFSDELNHASIIDGVRIGRAAKHVYTHADQRALDDALSAANNTGEKFVVTESLFSMDGDMAPLREIADVCTKHGANLIVDEAHAVGIYGPTGSGLISEYGIEEATFLSVNTAGKALGVSGAFVSADKAAIELLVNRCRSFIFSTAPIPATALCISRAIGILCNDDARRNDLRQKCASFAASLSEHGIPAPESPTHIVPVIIGDSEIAVRVAKSMQARGFDVRAIRPPTVPEGTSRLRVSLNTKLSQQNLREFVMALSEVMQLEDLL
ncbi:MAG: 8-amino-7-oxononanoate synthase [Pyrinomonadaceae bacterium]|nr:8-amino-7-oxononanoate synthase [Pyrinomonadaceae bacterium]